MMTNGIKGLGLGLIAAVMAIATPVTMTTTSFNTWKSGAYQTGAPTELDFVDAISATSYSTASGITMTPSRTATTPAFNFVGMDNGNYSLTGDNYAKTLAGSADNGAYIQINFQTAENAFLLGFNNSPAQYTVTLSDGEVFTTTSRLLGFSMSHTITGLTVATTPGTQAVINDFWFGVSALAQDAPTGGGSTPTSPTPEPGTLLLMAGGSLTFAGVRRRVAVKS